ncbi:MAG: alkaline phosphatase family protein, partial [Caldilineaceae bacterium]
MVTHHWRLRLRNAFLCLALLSLILPAAPAMAQEPDAPPVDVFLPVVVGQRGVDGPADLPGDLWGEVAGDLYTDVWSAAASGVWGAAPGDLQYDAEGNLLSEAMTPNAVGAANWGRWNPWNKESLVFFASDGLRQDLVQQYARDGIMPAMARLLRTGAIASDAGLLTQAPPNTGAGWFTLATGAWPGVHGSTNNTFHVNGAPFANRTSAFDPGIVQAESLAQSAERGGKKVVQIEWAGGRNSVINGPTLDFRAFFSGRGVATNFIAPTDDAAFTTAFGLQFDHPAGFAGQAPFPG